MPSGVYKHKPKSKEQRKSISKAMNRPEVKKRHKEAMKIAMNRPEVKAKLRKPRSKKAKANMKGHCGVYIRTEEHKKNMRKPKSEEAKRKMRGHSGVYERTEEHKKKLRKPHHGSGVYVRTKSTWNKNLTKKTDERVAKMGKSISKTTTKFFEDPKNREKQSKIITIAMNKSEVKIKLSKGQIKRFKDLKEREKASKIALKRFQDPKEREKQSKRMIEAQNRPEAKEKKKKNATKSWTDPEFQKKQAIARVLKPNNLELLFDELTPDIVRYVGDLQFFIVTNKRTHNPDFKVHNQKKIIELFGDYWHEGEDPNNMIKEYKRVGWNCKVFWEHEIYNEPKKVLEEVLEFIKEKEACKLI